jgi:UDP-N-acetylglucosamine 2-epimerase (non-hydrolysing)
VFLVAGTRPEAIKLAPVATVMAERGRLAPMLVATGQHPTMVHQALETFDLKPDVEIWLDRDTGELAELAAALLGPLDRLLQERRPAAVVVQGDTTTALVAGLAASWLRIPVVHLEAGLRSHDPTAPFPEEANRRLLGQIASLHLAPTAAAARNVLAENPRADVLTVGNTVVDAAVRAAEREPRWGDADAVGAVHGRAVRGESRVVLVTAHRRESWGAPLHRILWAVRRLVRDHDDVEVLFPVHPNPVVAAQVHDALGGVPRVTLTGPLPYDQMVNVLAVATLVLSDSGGVQEEAPSFQVPVLVLREVTERAEAVDAGCAVLVGSDEQRIVGSAGRLLADEAARRDMTACGNPFGDGCAAERVERAVAWLLDLDRARPRPFRPGTEAGRRTGRGRAVDLQRSSAS